MGALAELYQIAAMEGKEGFAETGIIEVRHIESDAVIALMVRQMFPAVARLSESIFHSHSLIAQFGPVLLHEVVGLKSLALVVAHRYESGAQAVACWQFRQAVGCRHLSRWGCRFCRLGFAAVSRIAAIRLARREMHRMCCWLMAFIFDMILQR